MGSPPRSRFSYGTSAAVSPLRRGRASPTEPPPRTRLSEGTSAPDKDSDFVGSSSGLPPSTSSWLESYLGMEQTDDTLGNFSGSDLLFQKSFPSDAKNRMVKIHSESLQNIIHVLEADYHNICNELGDKEMNEISGSLEVKLDHMLKNLKEARKKRRGRWDEFVDVVEQLEAYSSSMSPVEFRPSAVLLSHKPNLSLKRLTEMRYLLKLFQKDKNTPRHFKAIYLLCDALNLDFAEEIFRSDNQDDGSTVFMLENVVERLQVLKKDRLTNTANDNNMETKLMEEISKKKKVLSKLVSQSHLNAQDYELDISIEDVKAGKVEATLMIKKLQCSIMKLKKELKLREEIIDGAEKIFNTHNESQLLSFSSAIGALLEKVETWESYHKEDYMYNERHLKTELLKRMQKEVSPSSSNLSQTCEDHVDISMSPSVSPSSSSASESSSDRKSKDSDYSPESSQSDDNMQDYVVPETDSEDSKDA